MQRGDRPDMTLDVYRGRKTTIQQSKEVNIKKEGVTSFLENRDRNKVGRLKPPIFN